MRELIDREIKGYKIVQLIGTGGFGAVYRAHQDSVDREVAIKVILPEHANNPKFIRNFDSEARLIARLEHPFVVPLFDYWREPNSAYIVMRYYSGRSLSQYLVNEGKLAPADVARMLDQIASALDAAHRNNIIHRDIKPANIMLDGEFNAYLGDFGLAKNLAENSDERRFVGSPAYIAPEIIQRQDPDKRADIYSLGFVLHEMLTGIYAYTHVTPPSSVHSVFDFHLYEPVPEIPTVSDAINFVIQRATAKDPNDRYDSAVDMAKAFRKALDEEPSQILLENLINPYKGLRAFEEADANHFFGRRQLVRKLISRMEEDVADANFLALVGPSGSGKSSAVYAGLLPELRKGAIHGSEDWFYVDIMPGAEPIVQLVAGLRSIATQPIDNLNELLRQSPATLKNILPDILPHSDDTLLLVIDHFEELFTQTANAEERKQFLDLMVHGLACHNLRILVLLRADFYDRPLMYEEFGQLFQRRTEVILPLHSMELADVIVQPAKEVGLAIQPELCAAMIAEVRDEAAALPLLQYALTDMFERNTQSEITLKTYQAIGGIAGALAHRADEIYDQLLPEQQEATRQIFLRLVTLGEGTEDTRRRAKRSELLSVVGDNHILQSVLDTFGVYRFLTFDNDEETREPTVEVAHEALIREWQRLRQWLDDSRDDIRQQRSLNVSAQEWETAKDDASYLLRGAHLDQLIDWSQKTRVSLNDLEERYLRVSINQMEAEVAQEQERQAHEAALEKRSRQIQRVLIVGLFVGFIGAIIFTYMAMRAEKVARSMALAASAQKALALGDNDAALSLARLSVYINDVPFVQPHELAITSLAQVAHAQGLIYEKQALDRPIEHIAISPDGATALLSSGFNQSNIWQLRPPDGGNGQPRPPRQNPPSELTSDIYGIVVWDIETGVEQRRLIGHEAMPTDILYLPLTEETLPLPYNAVSADMEGTIIFWDVETGEAQHSIQVQGGDITLSTDESGETLLAAVSAVGAQRQTAGVHIFIDIATGEIINQIPELSEKMVFARITPDGQKVVSAHFNGKHIIWDRYNPDDAIQFGINPEDIRPTRYDMILSPNGEIIATNIGGTDIMLWDIDGKELGIAHADASGSHRITFSPDSQYLLTMSNGAEITLWNIDGSFRESSTVIGNDTTVSVAFSPNNEIALFGSNNGMLRSYAVLPREVGLLTEYSGQGFGRGAEIVTNGDETFLVTVQEENNRSWLVQWDIETGERVNRVPFNRRMNGFSQPQASPDGTLLIGQATNSLFLYELPQMSAENCPFCIDNRPNAPSLDVMFLPNTGVDSIPLSAVIKDGNTFSIWNIEARDTEVLFEARDGTFQLVDVSSDGQYVLIGTGAEFRNDTPSQPTNNNNPVELLWIDVTTGSISHRHSIEGEVMEVRFVPDSLDIVLATRISGANVELNPLDLPAYTRETIANDTTEVVALVIIDHKTGDRKQKPLFVGHLNSINSINFSSDGKRMITGSSDESVIVWNFSNGNILYAFATENGVIDARFTPDDSSIITVSEDDSIKRWRSTPFTLEEAIAYAESHRYVRFPTISECRRYQMQDFCDD